MRIHFENALENLKKEIIKLGGMVEDNVKDAVRSFLERDKALAQDIIKRDDEIDQMEIAIEEECLKILALYHPVASDLRFVIVVLKINNDLERIGDLAVNIAKKSRWLAEREQPVDLSDVYRKMAAKTTAMLKEALDSLVKRDPILADAVIAADKEVNKMKRQIRKLVISAYGSGTNNPSEMMFRYYAVARNLENIADLATSIAEEVIYLETGKIIRHSHLINELKE
ncbi:MAG: phosphate transport system regulatory protein PhoU [Candidatus Hydrogenedentota bacterium]|nr:MAG: phosphate transport system regulatory protein PhoU [Candidatus Hydrogenedentota bacterium]